MSGLDKIPTLISSKDKKINTTEIELSISTIIETLKIKYKVSIENDKKHIKKTI